MMVFRIDSVKGIVTTQPKHVKVTSGDQKDPV